MTKEEKGQIISELGEKFANSNYFYITDAGGLSVAKINAFRKLCYSKGIEYRVVKNTLIKKALETKGVDFSEFNAKVLKGFSGILFAESGNAPGKLLKEFYKTGTDKPKFKGAYVDTEIVIGEENLDFVTNIKSKNELIADVVALLQSPAKNVISGLQNGGQKLSGILKTLSEKPE